MMKCIKARGKEILRSFYEQTMFSARRADRIINARDSGKMWKDIAAAEGISAPRTMQIYRKWAA